MAKKQKRAKVEVEAEANDVEELEEGQEVAVKLQIPRLKIARMPVKIVGISPLIMKRFGPLAQAGVEDRQQPAGKSKIRKPRDAKAEVEDGLHRLSNGKGFGFPAGGVKKAIVSGTHKDLGLAMTAVKRAFFLLPDDLEKNLIKIEKCGKPKTRVDRVRLKGMGGGSTDVRYRAYFPKWEMTLNIEYDAERIDPETLVALIQRGGWSTGIGEWRPERNGEYGRFAIREGRQK